MSTSPAFPIEAPTAEHEWITFVAGLPELAISMRPVVVVAPHPDDETLAVGGLLAMLGERKVSASILAVTDGEASHPDLPGLAVRRRREQTAALAELGFGGTVERLALPDSGLGEHRSQIRSCLLERCDHDTVLIAPWQHDGHADHDVCGSVARGVAAEVGATLWAYPVWAWQWIRPEELEPWAVRKITLDDPVRVAKAKALDHYRTQLTDELGPPIVSADAARRFARPWEAVIHVQ